MEIKKRMEERKETKERIMDEHRERGKVETWIRWKEERKKEME